MEEDIVRTLSQETQLKPESQVTLLDQLFVHTDSSSTRSSKWSLSKLKLRPVKKPVIKHKPKTVLKPRYFTSGYGINEQNKKDLNKEPSPYHYPKDMEEFAYRVMTKAWRNDVRIEELKEKCSNKPSYKGRQRKDLLARLYVEDPTIDSMKSILDIAPEYFKVVEGRPIPDKLDIRNYIEVVRDSLRTKIVNGYREDDIMLIEENLLLEQKVIEKILENYNQYVNVFEEFLYRDHTLSMQLLRESEAAVQEAFEKYEEYKTVAKKYGSIKSSLYKSEEKWKNCQTYEKFLYLVSPFSWKKQKKIFTTESAEEVDDNLLGKYRLSLINKEPSLSDIIDNFNKEYRTDYVPDLYFTDPEQLLDVFRFMEMQNLNSLLHSEELAVPLEQVRDGMRCAEEMFDREIANLKETIDKLEGGISWEEERAKYLEELALKLIGNEFKRLIMDDEVLNLHVFVEEVYETRIGPNDANLHIDDMMKAIEARYRQELLALDKVPAEQVAQLESGCYAEQMMVMRLAEKAAKQYAELEQLTYRLNKAFAPPYQKTKGKVLKNRSPPIAQRPAPPPPPRALTTSEMEYLEFFTDFCKFTDDPKDYGIDNVTKVGSFDEGDNKLIDEVEK